VFTDIPNKHTMNG